METVLQARANRMQVKAKTSGFTLIEVMITVVIVAILAAVALPSYRNYQYRGKIPDAVSNLSAKRVKMEQYFQDNKTYLPPSGQTNAGDDDTTTSKYFDFSAKPGGAESRTATGYTAIIHWSDGTRPHDAHATARRRHAIASRAAAVAMVVAIVMGRLFGRRISQQCADAPAEP